MEKNMNKEKKLILFIEEHTQNEIRIEKLSKKHNTDFLKQKKIEFRPEIRYDKIKNIIDLLFFILGIGFLFIIESVYSKNAYETFGIIFIFTMLSAVMSSGISKIISLNFFNIQTKLSYLELKMFKNERRILFKRKSAFNKDKKEICSLIQRIENDYSAISRELKKVNPDIFVEEYINALHSEEITDSNIRITTVLLDQFPLLFQETLINNIRKKKKEKNFLDY